MLFAGQEVFQQTFVDGAAAAPEDATAVDTVAFALQAASVFFPDDRRSHSRLRQAIIAANPVLQQRELLTMASLSAGIADVLRDRGVPEPQPWLAAQTRVTAFGVAFGQWMADGEQRSLADVERDVLGELRTLVSTAT